MKRKLIFTDPVSDAERAAIAILRDAKLETDEDYKRLIDLLDENGEKYSDGDACDRDD